MIFLSFYLSIYLILFYSILSYALLCYAMLFYSVLSYPILSIYTCGSVSALVVSRSALPMARTSFLVFVLSDLKMA